MLYFKVEEERVYTICGGFSGRTQDMGIQHRWDWKTFDQAKEIARRANETSGFEQYIAIDNGPYISPRYDVVELPKIGDLVSYGFNGDYYPCGTITKISKTLKKIETSTGECFYRRKETARWIKDGTWTLVPGVRDERNPCF